MLVNIILIIRHIWKVSFIYNKRVLWETIIKGTMIILYDSQQVEILN